MKNCYIFLSLFLLTIFHSAEASRFEAYFLDRIQASNRDVIEMSEIALKTSENLELKRMARKFEREARRDNKKMRDWRSSYYGEIPEVWVIPSKSVKLLQQEKKSAFDISYLNNMLIHFSQARKHFLNAQEKGEKSFIKTYAEIGLKHGEKNIKVIQDLKIKLEGP